MFAGRSTAAVSMRRYVAPAVACAFILVCMAWNGAHAGGGPEDVVYLSEEDWTGRPQIEPVWILEVRRDSAFVVRNQFVDDYGERVPDRSFPISSVLVQRSGGGIDENGGRYFYTHRVNLGVQADGSLKEPAVEWHREPPPMDKEYGAAYTPSRKVLLVWTRSPRTVQVYAADGRCLTDLGYDVTSARCFDPAERILGFVTEEMDLGQSKIELQRIIILDYDGQILYETDWTECEFWNGVAYTRIDPDVFWLDITDCRREGSYMLRLDEGTMHSLENLPDGAWAFADNGRHVAVYNRPRFSVFDLSAPETPELLTTIEVSGIGPSKVITRAELSNDMHLLAYGPLPIDNMNTPQPHFNVLDPGSGKPLARLVKVGEMDLVGPIAFVGDYVFCGTGFGGHGFMSDSKYIQLYDLRGLVGEHE